MYVTTSECDSCGTRPLAAHARLQQCPECERRYCTDCALGGDVVEFGRCPKCPDNPELRLEGSSTVRVQRA